MARPTPTPQSAIDEWLAKGNEITKCAPGERSEDGVIGYTHSWGKRKKTDVPEDSTKVDDITPLALKK